MSAQAAFAAALLDPARPCPQGLTSWNGSDPGRRFDVYRNNVVVSLVDALADTFPVLQRLVGEAFFRAMAREHVLASPPTSPMLVHYGAGFAGFVQAFAPAQGLPYLADMARLEFARVQAYHAADADPVAQDALLQALAAPERVAQLRLRLHPSVQCVSSAYAVTSLWAAHQGEGEIARVYPLAAEDTLIVRAGLEVQVVLLAPGVATWVAALGEGRPLGEAAQRALTEHTTFDLSASLALLLRLGAIASLE